MKFTKEEISLCKQVAEKQWKEIEYGDWIQHEGRKERVVLVDADIMIEISDAYIDKAHIIPLWTISACLQFLRERNFVYTCSDHQGLLPRVKFPTAVEIARPTKSYRGKSLFHGKAPLEACLKAVLAVLEEGK